MRVCQFRHDGKWTSAAATGTLPHQEDLHVYFTEKDCSVKQIETGAPFAKVRRFERKIKDKELRWNVRALSELCGHRDLGVQDLRDGTTLLGRFGVFLKCGGI